MNYIEVTFTFGDSPAEAGEILIALLGEIGYESFQENENGFSAYIPEKEFSLDKIDEIAGHLLSEHHVNNTYRIIKEENWNAVWESNFEPVKITDDCVIRATFHAPENVPYEILVDPKMSFGTGHHETTWLMAKALLETEVSGKQVLDMGCGTGVLAILASMKGAAGVLAVDIDEWAYNNTLENIQLNKRNNISVLQGNVDSISGKYFDLILANINRNILLEQIRHYSETLKPGGKLFLSGIFREDEQIISEEAEKHALYKSWTTTKNKWIAIGFTKL
ncbi:MAG TPA: 50S ribosomal protein L11 methyltransferase [Bacteroidales bacterium]|nr:50S ribosomal protein L11 methyltransferase [Bacteroidales bacterium]